MVMSSPILQVSERSSSAELPLSIGFYQLIMLFG